MAFVPLVSLSLTGCVAAIPLAMQLAAGGDAISRLCGMKIPGQAGSLCDQLPLGDQTPVASTAQPPAKAQKGATINTAAR